MMYTIEPVFRMRWNEVEGAYESTGEQIGYQCLGNGSVLAYGETESEAWENAMEDAWGTSRGGDAQAGAVVATR
ncbi:MAG: hypothetical protein A3A27_02115 [Candidatus Wildermuthbacteria bacterium RIFCSPLOWO2_01_FULL_47_18]|uniref:Uncharacterized protein n=1 Tax=Candidatus Wildermuthbacteria bacterium RIFCSPLOWO2_01_FULL_47_18 TaxID=1802460 RepID=A0A1G2RII5_9BACT|nr:MAG: hypothetical protein A3A27_02115 [Candidatus Wildermuthbacteria bacterium RIFCSPLOWO2_01_FULL_47_18]